MGFLDLGPASDGDQTGADKDQITIVTLVDPPTKHIQFKRDPGYLIFDFVALFSAASESQLRFNVKITLTDNNFYSRSSTYYIEILVPHTPLEGIESSAAYTNALTNKYEQMFGKKTSEPGELKEVQVDSNGLLSMTFTEPLPSNEGALAIAENFIIIKLISNTETPASKKRFSIKIEEATRYKIVYKLIFENPLSVSDKTVKNLDELDITILKPLFQQKVVSIPKQNSNAAQALKIEQTTQAMQAGSTAIMATTLVTNLILRASIS